MPRFDDLSGKNSDSPSTVDEAAAQALTEIIEWMRGSGSFEWAEETLTGIYDKVIERKYASQEQQRAVRNIWHSRLPDREFGDLD
jgi:hypothetical protein